MKHNKTISIPEDLWNAMQKRPEVNWSKVAADAFRDHLAVKSDWKNIEMITRCLAKALREIPNET